MFIGVLRPKSSRACYTTALKHQSSVINWPSRTVYTLGRINTEYSQSSRTLNDTSASSKERNLTILIRSSPGCLLKNFIQNFEMRPKTTCPLNVIQEKRPSKNHLLSPYPTVNHSTPEHCSKFTGVSWDALNSLNLGTGVWGDDKGTSVRDYANY